MTGPNTNIVTIATCIFYIKVFDIVTVIYTGSKAMLILGQSQSWDSPRTSTAFLGRPRSIINFLGQSGFWDTFLRQSQSWDSPRTSTAFLGRPRDRINFLGQ